MSIKDHRLLPSFNLSNGLPGGLREAISKAINVDVFINVENNGHVDLASLINGINQNCNLRILFSRESYVAFNSIKQNENDISSKKLNIQVGVVSETERQSFIILRNDHDLFDIEMSPEIKNTINISWSWGDPKNSAKQTLSFFNEKFSQAEQLDYNESVNAYNELIKDFQPNLDKKFELYKHQQKAIDAWLKNDGKGIFKMCTGAGKTISALWGVKSLIAKLDKEGKQIPGFIVCVPTVLLLNQWEEELNNANFKFLVKVYGDNPNWEKKLETILSISKMDMPTFALVTYSSFNTSKFINIINRLSVNGNVGCIIADEMHNLKSPERRDALSSASGYLHYRLGLSATPEIEGDITANKYLNTYFGGIIAEYNLSDAIKAGVLTKYHYYPVIEFLNKKLSREYLKLLKSLVEEHSNVELHRQHRDLINKSGVQLDGLRRILNNHGNKFDFINNDLSHTLVYCPPGFESNEEAGNEEIRKKFLHQIVKELQNKSIQCESILANTDRNNLKNIISRFDSGETKVMCGIGCLDEGFDVPSIKRAIITYSIDRERQFVQRRGRILRKDKNNPQKIAEIYDIVLLPHGSDLPSSETKRLLKKEMRRYRIFASDSVNHLQSLKEIDEAINVATGSSV